MQFEKFENETWQSVHEQANSCKTHPGTFACPFCKTRERKMNVDVKDALRFAVVRREVAEDDYFAALYREAQAVKFEAEGLFDRRHVVALRGAAEQAQNAMIDARLAAMLEADAYGLINLFDKGGDVELRTAEIVRFSGMSAKNASHAHA